MRSSRPRPRPRWARASRKAAALPRADRRGLRRARAGTPMPTPRTSSPPARAAAGSGTLVCGRSSSRATPMAAPSTGRAARAEGRPRLARRRRPHAAKDGGGAALVSGAPPETCAEACARRGLGCDEEAMAAAATSAAPQPGARHHVAAGRRSRRAARRCPPPPTCPTTCWAWPGAAACPRAATPPRAATRALRATRGHQADRLRLCACGETAGGCRLAARALRQAAPGGRGATEGADAGGVMASVRVRRRRGCAAPRQPRPTPRPHAPKPRHGGGLAYGTPLRQRRPPAAPAARWTLRCVCSGPSVPPRSPPRRRGGGARRGGPRGTLLVGGLVSLGGAHNWINSPRSRATRASTVAVPAADELMHLTSSWPGNAFPRGVDQRAWPLDTTLRCYARRTSCCSAR